MFRCNEETLVLEGPAGKLLLPAQDEVGRKFAMLYEGECTELGPVGAAEKYGYSKQRFYQLRSKLQNEGVLGLQDHKRGPKGKSRRSDAVEREVIRHRFLDPDASPEVIAQKLRQTGHSISIRSVQRVLAEYGLSKKNSISVGQNRLSSKRR